MRKIIFILLGLIISFRVVSQCTGVIITNTKIVVDTTIATKTICGSYIANTTTDNGLQSAFYIPGRILDGNTENGHGFKDDTDFREEAFSYCSFDAKARVNSGSSENFDHLIGFQSRVSFETEGTTNNGYSFGDFTTIVDGTVNNLYGFYSAPYIYSGPGGTVGNRFGARIRNTQGGGTLANNYGLYIDFLDGGYNDNVGIYLDGEIETYMGTGNHGFGSRSYGSGVGIISIGNATTEPSISSSTGAFLWAYGNKLKTNANIIVTQYNVSSLNTAPSSASDTGTTGEIRVCSDGVYICIATNTWIRQLFSTW